MFSSYKLLSLLLAWGSAITASPIENKAADAAIPASAATPPPGYDAIYRCETYRQGSDRQRECYLQEYGRGNGYGRPTPTVVVYPNTRQYPEPYSTIIYENGYPRETIIYDNSNPRETVVYGNGPRPRETVIYGDPNRPYDRDQGTIIVYQPTRTQIQATIPVGYQAGPTVGAPNWD